MVDDGLAELAALQQLHVALAVGLHQPVEVVRDAARADGAVHALDDEVRRVVPAQVAEHHLAGQDHAARVHLVLARVLRRRAVGGLEDGVPSLVVDVAARGDADAADLERRT